MNLHPTFAGSRLHDLLARRAADGYLDLIATTDRGAFDLQRNSVQVRPATSDIPAGFDSWLEESYRGAVVEQLWTDGDSLFILLDQDRCVVYEFTLPDASGASETLLFLRGPADVNRIKRHLEEEPDAREL